MIQLRSIKEDEFEEMSKIWNKYFTKLTNTNKWINSKELKLFKESGTEFIGLYTDRLVGFAVIRKLKNKYALDQLAVKNVGIGNGKQLLEYIIGKYVSIESEIQVKNIKGINFFLSHGFKIKRFDARDQSYIVTTKKKDENYR